MTNRKTISVMENKKENTKAFDSEEMDAKDKETVENQEAQEVQGEQNVAEDDAAASPEEELEKLRGELDKEKKEYLFPHGGV